MLFPLLGRIVRRTWPLLLVCWGVLLFASWFFAPSWNTIARDQELAYLPANIPSRHAGDIYDKAFPNDKTGSNVVLVLHRSDASPDTLRRDLKFIEDDLEPRLRKIAEAQGGLAYEIKPTDEPLFSDENEPPKPPQPRSLIARIRTPNAPGMGSFLVSPDRKALLVVVELTPDFSSRSNWPEISKIEDTVRQLKEQGKVPSGLDVALTGSAVIGRDHALAQLQSVRITGILTVVLVAGLLIFIYRAPLLAVIPLATVYLAVQISLNVLVILAEVGHVTLFQGLQIYITILAYGAGVDYCLFLTARYKEELDRGTPPGEAVASAIGSVGTALAASAATVMCGIAMMMFAQFGKFQQAGFAIPLCLLIVLCATLTFSPSVLCLAGRWAFWPRHQRGQAGTNGTTETGSPGSRETFGGARLERIWERVGQFLLRRAGTVWLVTVALMAPFAIAGGFLYNHLSYDVIGDLPADASSAAGTRLLEKHFPAGIVGPVTILIIDPHLDFASDQGQELVERVTDQLRDHKQELGVADVRSLTAPLGITEAATQDFSGLDLPKATRADATKRAALDHYTTDLGERGKIGTRLDVILAQSPFSRRSVESLGGIEQTIRATLLPETCRDCQFYVVGPTASIRDLSVVMQQDRRRIELLVLASVFVILVLLLRRFVAPVYLLLSVLFSYYTTLGVSFAVFWLLDPYGFTGIDWKVAIFLFTILIAVGEDYNIFLMTRIDEEQRRFGPVRGITEALDRTGPIISSCGIIMAGTFCSLLLSGTLTEMKQLGFALAFGVLLDTFVVRPILVPSFLILLRTGRLSLLGGPRKESPVAAEPAPPQQVR